MLTLSRSLCLSVLPPRAQRLLQHEMCLGKGLDRGTQNLCGGGKMLCLLLGMFVKDSGDQAGVPQGALYPPCVVASLV